MPAKTNKKTAHSKTSQKASKQCFYSKVLDEAEKLDFELAAGVSGIDDETALLRVKIKSILGDDPNNISDIVKVTNTLERLVRTRYKIAKEQRKWLKEAIGNVLKDIALPLGIGIGAAIDK